MSDTIGKIMAFSWVASGIYNVIYTYITNRKRIGEFKTDIGGSIIFYFLMFGGGWFFFFLNLISDKPSDTTQEETQQISPPPADFNSPLLKMLKR